MFKLLSSPPVRVAAEPTPGSKQIAAAAMKGELWCAATHQGDLYTNNGPILKGIPPQARAVTVLSVGRIASTDRETVTILSGEQSFPVVVGRGLQKRKRDSEDKPSTLTSPSPDQLAIATQGGKIHIWNVGSQKTEQTFDAHGQNICSLSGGNNTLVSAGDEGVVKLWELRQEAPIWQIGRCSTLDSLQAPHSENAAYCGVNENLSDWVYCAKGETMKTWSLDLQVPLWQPKMFVRPIKVAQDQQHVLIGIGTTLFVTDLRMPSGWVYSMNHDSLIVGVGTCGEGVYTSVDESGVITFKSPQNEMPVIYDSKQELLTVAFGGATKFLPVSSGEIAQLHEFHDPYASWF